MFHIRWAHSWQMMMKKAQIVLKQKWLLLLMWLCLVYSKGFISSSKKIKNVNEGTILSKLTYKRLCFDNWKPLLPTYLLSFHSRSVHYDIFVIFGQFCWEMLKWNFRVYLRAFLFLNPGQKRSIFQFSPKTKSYYNKRRNIVVFDYIYIYVY